MLRGCSIACTLLTILLALCGGDHLPAAPADAAAWASIGVLSPRCFARRNFRPFDWGGSKPVISPAVNTPWAGERCAQLAELGFTLSPCGRGCLREAKAGEGF